MLSANTHVFSEVMLHINWHCHHDMPLIDEAMEQRLFRFLREYCVSIKGVHFLEVGGTETHVHLLLQVEPHLCPADLVGKLKGASAHEINKALGRTALKWQRGYGIVSFAARDLPALRRYVLTQKEHHAAGTAREKLESTGSGAGGEGTDEDNG